MKILHLISSLGFFGAEQVLLSIAAGVPGFEMQVGAIHNLHNPHFELEEKSQKLGLTTVNFPCAGQADLRIIFAIERYLHKQKIDVLHTHNYKSNFYGLLAARMAGIPVISTAHGFTDTDHKVSLYEKLDRFILRFFDKVAVVADPVLPNFPLDKKVVIPNGIDVERFRSANVHRSSSRAELGLSESDFVIGTVGRLSPEKNQILLIQAIAQLIIQSPNLHNLKLLIVGDGPELESLKIEVGKWKIEKNVIFAGLQTDMPRIYSAMDVFVLPSLTEGVPLTILEAMAANVPVIATKVGGISQIIENNRTGLLIPPQDQVALIQMLGCLLNDSATRERLANAAFTAVKENYSLGRMCGDYKKVYQDLNGPCPI